jgi:hypothetical protein
MAAKDSKEKALPPRPKIAKATKPSELKSLPTRKKLRGFE